MKLSTMKGLLLLAGMTCSAAALAAATLVQDVRVFDGKTVHERRSVLLVDGVIADADFHGAAPQGARIVNGAGKTLLPGLIDSHVHAWRYFELPLVFGVTTQVDMFTPVPIMQEKARAMASGQNHGEADLFSAGTLITAAGGHGTEYQVKIPTLEKAADAQAFVDARIAEGSHFIKVVMEKGFGTFKFQSLDLATVKAVIDAAHRRGKLAVVHVSNLEDARAALEAGADGLAHLFMGNAISAADADGLARLAKERGAFVIPTFSVLESFAGVQPRDILGDTGFAGLLDKEQKASLATGYGKSPYSALLAAPKAVTAALRKAGVPVLAGTDSGNAGTQYGASLHHEMAALVDAGLTPQEALAAATSAPAAAFRLGKRGRIENGYKADLLLVDGNPAADIAATRRIVEVWKDGESTAPLVARQRQHVTQELAQPGKPLLPADGRISLLSDGKLASPFGVGWTPSSDRMVGGTSTVKLDVRPDPAGHAVIALEGEVKPGFSFPWAGVAFIPGAKEMQSADLSSVKRIAFRVRGDGQRYQLMVMARGMTYPRTVPFEAKADWAEVAVPLSAFEGLDPSGVTMVGFNAGPAPGGYRFEIADVRLLD
ncbi:CIA30 family protein [Massilia horti]|uniref:Amidohydrolase n=1 Tax=Massilia horti TaxID=2562153 RepID=A0A4Y9T554_9BURK|nr:CIA30 family protein [Massilia horti]TFW35580.1 amidohydrolase [Massilia horti]